VPGKARCRRSLQKVGRHQTDHEHQQLRLHALCPWDALCMLHVSSAGGSRGLPVPSSTKLGRASKRSRCRGPLPVLLSNMDARSCE
jgi:hypothetical protein